METQPEETKPAKAPAEQQSGEQDDDATNTVTSAASDGRRRSSRLTEKRAAKEAEAEASSDEEDEDDEDEDEEQTAPVPKRRGGGSGSGKKRSTSKPAKPSKKKKPKATAKDEGDALLGYDRDLKGHEHEEAALPTSLARMPLTNWPLWREEVLAHLGPVELMRLGLVSKLWRTVHSRDALWLPLLQKADEGDLARRLTETKTLTVIPPRTAYLRATTGRCATCNAWTPSVNAFTVEPTCWDCFKAACGEGKMMVKSKAAVQYLMSDKEVTALPHVTIGNTAVSFESTTFLWRPQVEAAAIARYEDGLAGLEADRAERKKKAEDNRANVLAKYEERKKKARAEGKRTPKYPKPSVHMNSKIDPADSGMMAGFDAFTQYAFMWAGFCGKHDASKPTRPRELEGTRQFFRCPHCHNKNPRQPQYTIRKFPSHAALMRDHMPTCPNKPAPAQAFGGLFLLDEDDDEGEGEGGLEGGY